MSDPNFRRQAWCPPFGHVSRTDHLPPAIKMGCCWIATVLAFMICLLLPLSATGSLAEAQTPAPATEDLSGDQPTRIVDAAGRELTITRPFTRIISLYPAHTENLASLGLDDEIIGIGSSDDYPPRLLERPRFSYREDAERFIAARPDLVLIRPMIARAYPQLIALLEEAGITVASLQPTSVEGIFTYWRQLGILTGREEQARRMVDDFERELAAIRVQVAAIEPQRRPRVFFSAIHRRMKTFAPQSIAIFVLEEAGGINVATDAPRVRQTNIADYGKERILAKGAEIDLFLAQQGRMNPISREDIFNEPGFGAIRAVREGRVELIDERIVSRPTLRILDGIRRVHTILYSDQPVAARGENAAHNCPTAPHLLQGGDRPDWQKLGSDTNFFPRTCGTAERLRPVILTSYMPW